MTDLPPLLPEVPHDDAVERAARERALARLRAAILTEADASSRPRPRRFVLAGAAVTAVAAAVAIAVVSGVDEGRVTPAPSAAAQVLLRTAAAAERAPAPGALAAGEFLYVHVARTEPHVVRLRGERFTMLVRGTDEAWTTRDGSGRIRSAATVVTFPTPADRAAWRRAGAPPARDVVNHGYAFFPGADRPVSPHPRDAFPTAAGRSALSYAQVRALPTDTARLERVLRRAIGPLTGFTPATRAGMARVLTLEYVGWLLRGAPLDAAQRTALLRVAARQPGVGLGRGVPDGAGGTGTAVRLEVPSDTNVARPASGPVPLRSTTLVVDPDRGLLLGSRATVRAGGRVDVDVRETYRAAVVGSTTERP